MPDKTDPVMPDAPATAEEVARAEELRAALDDPRHANEDAELARTLAAAWSPRDLDPDRHRALLERAFARIDAKQRSRKTTNLAWGAGAMVALAAGVCVVLWAQRRPSEVSNRAGASPVAMSRSTQPLFVEQFARLGGQTSRIDRIAMARAADLRNNEFTKWGVR
jgi:hypothetical protein